MAHPSAREVSDLQFGDHLCSFYDDVTDQMATAVAFVKQGMALGQCCIYVADDRAVPDLATAFAGAGLNVQAETARGALVFVGRDRWRNGGEFSIAGMECGVRALVNEVLGRGFPGAWIAVEMTWALGPDISAEQLAAWESYWNILIAGMPVVLLCQYNRRRIAPENLDLELHSHPLVMRGPNVLSNSFYEPPDLFADRAGHARRADWMLRQLEQARQAEEYRFELAWEKAARAQSEVACREMETLLDSMTEGVISVTTDLRVCRVNAFAARTLGVAPEHLVGRHVSEVFAMSDDSTGVVRDLARPVVHCLSLMEPMVIEEAWLRLDILSLAQHAERKVVPVSVTITPQLSPGEGAVILFHDISRRREVEELRHSLISLVSHELRTPLHHIKGFASTLLQKDIEWDPEVRRDFIETIDREADRLGKLIANLLDMSRLENGQTDRREAMPAQLLVRIGVSQAMPFLREHAVKIEVDHGLPSVSADREQFERVFVNLLENAAKYSPKGTAITVRAKRRHDQVVFAVSDEGVGIPQADQERVFDKFVRLSPTASPGTGLGLAICKAIVERHGGRIWVESDAHTGSTFLFTLPAVNGTGARAPRKRAEREDRHGWRSPRPGPVAAATEQPQTPL